jgi:hypothetical protein
MPISIPIKSADQLPHPADFGGIEARLLAQAGYS